MNEELELRDGMWVVDENNRTAIAYLNRVSNAWELHYVDMETGETVEIQEQFLVGVRQASIDNIPQCRRPEDVETLKRLGYN